MRASARINFFRFAALLVLLGGLGYYFSLQKEMWSVLGEVNSEYLFIMTLINCFFFLSNVMILKILLESFEIRLSVKESLSIYTLTRVGNLLTPLRGGGGWSL